MKTVEVLGTEIAVYQHEDSDYISLTDMVRSTENGSAMIDNWLRNKNTIEFLGIWEGMYNPDFNSLEFEGIRNQAGLNRFVLSVKHRPDETAYRRCGRQTTRWKQPHCVSRDHPEGKHARLLAETNPVPLSEALEALTGLRED